VFGGVVVNSRISITRGDFYKWLGKKDIKGFNELAEIAKDNKETRGRERITHEVSSGKMLGQVFPWISKLQDPIEDAIISTQLKNALLAYYRWQNPKPLISDLSVETYSSLRRIQRIGPTSLEELYSYIKRRK
jgi:hypothetical protein